MLRNRFFGGLSLILLANLAVADSAGAVEASGSAVKVLKTTTAAGPGGDRQLVTEGLIYMGDEVATNPNGLAQIQFADETKIVVGPNSRLVIDAFVFNPDNTASKVTVSAARGLFRFITGKSPKSAYSINMPTMTIGIRGTKMDLFAGSEGDEVVMHEGSAEGCDDGACMAFAQACGLYTSSAGGGGMGMAEGFDRQRRFAAHFATLQENQFRLEPDFRVSMSSCFTYNSRQFRDPPEDTRQERVAPAQPPSNDDDYDDYDDYDDECEGGCDDG